MLRSLFVASLAAGCALSSLGVIAAQTPVATPEAVLAPAEFVAEIPIDPAMQNWPGGVAVDAAGRLYVIDSVADVIRVFDQDGAEVATLGESGDEPGQFRFHDDVAAHGDLTLGPDGNLYVIDSFNRRIEVLSPNGDFIREWGSHGEEEGQFSWPAGIALDADGRVYVADGGTRRVQVFTGDGDLLAVWEPTEEDGGAFGDPADVAVDADGMVWVSDGSGNRLFRFDSDGNVIDVIGGSGTEPGQLQAPWGLAVDARGNLFAAEYFGNRIQVFAPDGTPLTTIGAMPGGGNPGEFSNPMHLTISPDGLLYVADEGNHRVQIFRLLPPLAPEVSETD